MEEDAAASKLVPRSANATINLSALTRKLALEKRAASSAGDDGANGQLLTRVQDALADEIGHMLDEGVVASARDVDLCMILGAGWPLHLGGITPYLDDCGAAERVNGKRFHG